jgi:hypothetical protein
MDKIQPLAAKTVYEVVPVSEKPEKPGWYHCIDADGENRFTFYNGKRWGNYRELPALVSWLRSVLSSFVHTPEEMEKLIGMVWDAAISYAIGDDAPDRTTFIQQLLNPGK